MGSSVGVRRLFIGSRAGRAVVIATLLSLYWVIGHTAASANTSVNLRPHLCFAPVAEPGPHVKPQSVDCEGAPETSATGWTWSRLDDPRRLDALAAGWHLLLPHRKLDAVAVRITYRDGDTKRLVRLGGALAVDWSDQGHAYFVSPEAGRDVAVLDIGFRSKSGNSALRYVEAVSADTYARRAANFRLVVGFFIGTVGSALMYNLLIGAGMRPRFQCIYIIWSALALVNGLFVSGLLDAVWPPLTGEFGVSANKLAVAGLHASGTLFLLALVEPGILPSRILQLGRASAMMMALTGLIAVVEWTHSIGLAGLLTPIFTVLNLVVIAAVAIVAVRRKSRVIWFYLLGWSPILVYGLFIVGHELRVVAFSEMLELGGMLAVAFESVVLSLAIADRFRHLQRDRNTFERAQHRAQAERAALQRVADTDQLTGLSNRRVFETTLEAAKRGEIDRLALILVDVDHFKSVNDRLGHEEGDELLCDVANQLRASVRGSDILVRLGGDEFAILVKGADARYVDHIIDGLVDVQRRAAPSAAGPVTFSIGAALLPDDDHDPERLYKNADLALYEAKRLGRARSHRYAPSLRSRDKELRLTTAPESSGCVIPPHARTSTVTQG